MKSRPETHYATSGDLQIAYQALGAGHDLVWLGDLRWRELLEEHNEAVRRVLARYSGREVDRAGGDIPHHSRRW